MKSSGVAVPLILLPASVLAQTLDPSLTGRIMLERCETFQNEQASIQKGEPVWDDRNAKICLGYMWSARDLYAMIDSDTKRPVIGPCLPPGTTVGHIVRVFVEYARTNAGALDAPVIVTLTPAMQRAFPCGST